jgi:hypothetical protein
MRQAQVPARQAALLSRHVLLPCHGHAITDSPVTSPPLAEHAANHGAAKHTPFWGWQVLLQRL